MHHYTGSNLLIWINIKVTGKTISLIYSFFFSVQENNISSKEPPPSIYRDYERIGILWKNLTLHLKQRKALMWKGTVPWNPSFVKPWSNCWKKVCEQRGLSRVLYIKRPGLTWGGWGADAASRKLFLPMNINLGSKVSEN